MTYNKNIIGGFLFVLLLLGLLVSWAITHPKQKPPPSPVPASASLEKREWGLCWENREKRRCGAVKKIVFHGPERQIVQMRVYFPSTSVTANFFRDPGSSVGAWNQPGESGIWTLEKTAEGGYRGTVTNYKGWEARLEVSKIIRIK